MNVSGGLNAPPKTIQYTQTTPTKQPSQSPSGKPTVSADIKLSKAIESKTKYVY